VAGGMATGALVVLAGMILPPFPRSLISGIVVAASVLSLAHAAGIVNVRVPQNARQVPQVVDRLGPIAGGLQFGFEMGTGLRTYMTTALPHVVVLAVLLVYRGGAFGIVAGAAFGFGRALTLLSRGTGEWARRWDSSMSRYGALFSGVAVAAGVVMILLSVLASV